MNITKETFRRNCKSNKYVTKSKKVGKSIDYSVLLSSLPAEIQDKYFSLNEDEDKELDIEVYSNAPVWAKNKADKYLNLFELTKGLKGQALKDFLERCGEGNSSLKTSYVAFMTARKKYEEFGVSALLPNYGHNRGQSVVSDEYFEYFKSLYLKERGPSAKSCWRMVLGYAKRTYGAIDKQFPSVLSFTRRLEVEIPEQFIYMARYGEAAWNRKYAIYLDRDYSNVIAGECWVSDHAQMDVMVFDECGRPTCPWLTVWRDFKTSKWLAWELYCGNPNSDRIFQTFYHSTLSHGLPKEVYLDNGKDYRAKDFAGGRSRCDVNKATPMLKLIGVNARFALPYNAQTKPVERDFLKVKEMFSRHLKGFRGGNVTERPSKLKDEIKDESILKFTEFQNIFNDFIENVLNKLPSNGKNLKGKSPNQLWSEEFKLKRVIAKEELKLFCMRTSKAFTITRNGVKDGEFGLNYWGEWMVAHKGQKVYLRRDSLAYQDAWVFDSENDKYLGKADATQLKVAASAESDIEKSQLKKAYAMKQKELKLAKLYIQTQGGYDIAENMENFKASLEQTTFEDKSKVLKIKRTKMSEAILQEKANKKMGAIKYSNCVSDIAEKKQIFLYESEKKRYIREAN